MFVTLFQNEVQKMQFLIFFLRNIRMPKSYSNIRSAFEYSFPSLIIGEPNYKYGQQEQVTVKNHNKRTAFERSVLKYWRA